MHFKYHLMRRVEMVDHSAAVSLWPLNKSIESTAGCMRLERERGETHTSFSSGQQRTFRGQNVSLVAAEYVVRNIEWLQADGPAAAGCFQAHTLLRLRV